MDNLQILVRKIIVDKPSFRAEANEQLKHQYAHKLHDQYYVAFACSGLQTSDHMESFTQFCGHLALTFGSCSKFSKISSLAATIETTSSMISEESQELQLSKIMPNTDKTGSISRHKNKLSGSSKQKAAPAFRTLISSQHHYPGCGQ